MEMRGEEWAAVERRAALGFFYFCVMWDERMTSYRCNSEPLLRPWLQVLVASLPPVAVADGGKQPPYTPRILHEMEQVASMGT